MFSKKVLAVLFLVGSLIPFASISWAATALPDLIITSISMSPANPIAGQAVTFSAVVKNQGTAPAVPPSGLKLGVGFAIDGTEITWESTDGSSLAPGASITLTANSGPAGVSTWTATAGAHTFFAKVNDQKKITESNYNNNTFSEPITVAAALPDLIITSVSMSPANPVVGQAVTFSAVVKNQGNGATPSNTEIGGGFFIDGTQTNWASADKAPLAPGLTTTLTANGGPGAGNPSTWVATAGTHTLMVNVNVPNRFSESNFANNSLTQTITVGAGTPSAISPVKADNNLSGTVGTLLNTNLGVLVTDSSGNLLSGVRVNWSVTGGGTLTNASSFSTNGLAQNSLKLGTTAGPNVVTATINGTKISTTLTENGIAAQASKIVASGSNSGAGFVGTAVKLSVIAEDVYGNVTNGTSVNWTVSPNEGSLASPQTTTNASGVATNTFTLGATPGIDTAVATIQGTKASVTFTETGGIPQPVPTGKPVAATISISGTPNYVSVWNGTYQNKVPSPTPSSGLQPFGYPSPSVVTTTPATISSDFMGFSFNKISESHTVYTNDQPLADLFQRLTPTGQTGILRIGGSDVETAIWTPGGSGGVEGQVAPQDIENLAGFLASSPGWKVLYGVNLAYTGTVNDLCNTYTGTPTQIADQIAAANAAVAQQSAAEVVYAYKAIGASRFYGVEIGNEPDLYCDKPLVLSSNYFSRWTAIAQAIRAQLPDILLTGPAMGRGNLTLTTPATGTPTSGWTEPFVTQAQAEGLGVSLITQHNYPGFGEPHPINSPSPTFSSLADLFAADTTEQKWGTDFVNNLQALGYLSLVALPSPIPYRVDETNTYEGRPLDLPTGIDDGEGSALYMIDHLFNIALNGGSGVNVINGPGNDSLSYNTFGFISGYGLPDDGKDPVLSNVFNEYYGLMLFSMAGPGTLLQTSTNTGNLTDVSTYSVKRADGSLAIIVNNKDDVASLSFTLNAGRTINSATLTLLTAPSLASTKVTLQGATAGIDGSFTANPPYTLIPINGTSVQGYVNPASAALIIIK